MGTSKTGLISDCPNTSWADLAVDNITSTANSVAPWVQLKFFIKKAVQKRGYKKTSPAMVYPSLWSLYI